MRYIGNKTRLLDFIEEVLKDRGIAPGLAVDPFTGTASVARALKQANHRVVAGDIMEYGHVFARAYVATSELPSFGGIAAELNGDPPTLRGAIAALDRLSGEPGFIHEHYSPAGTAAAEHGRMYFTPENAARIDVVRSKIQQWRDADDIDDAGYYLLTAALIEAADRVANTAGVYAAFIKSWQPNADRPLELRVPEPVLGQGSRATRGDAATLLEELGPCDLLYLDPPYNDRQYPGYYHIPELLAEGWFDEEPELRGKTGLLPDADKRSDWSRRTRCEAALEELLARSEFRYLVMSYNSEGLIGEAAIERLLKKYGRASTYRRYTRNYRRYRSDSDGEERRYSGDSVREYLYCVDR